jgi:biotin operon repressor
MRQKTLDMINKISKILEEKEYIQAPDLAKSCNLSTSSIYRLIRVMRQEGIGIHITNKGYILSEYAGLKDDTNFLRRLNARRVSDYFAIQSSMQYIKKRWKGIQDKRTIRTILESLAINQKSLKTGMDSIKFLEDKHKLDQV